MFIQFGDPIGIVTYTIGFFGWFWVWKFLDGYRLMREFRLLYLPFVSALVTFAGNTFLAFFQLFRLMMLLPICRRKR